MLKYQVSTLTRKDKRRQSILEISSDEKDSDTWRPRPSSFRGRSASISSLSSVGSTSDTSIEWGTMRIYTSAIRADTDYKTVFVSTATTAADLVRMVLSKFRLLYRDPKLYYLTMAIRTKREGFEVENLLILGPEAKPLELQNCHPKEKSRFSLEMGLGIPVRIFDYCISPESNYKSVLVSTQTTCAEAVSLILQSHRLSLCNDNFVLVSVHTRTGYEYILPSEACLVSVEEHSDEFHEFHLRPLSKVQHSARSSRLKSTASPVFEQLTTHFEACAL